jgi:hypothetical protein
MLLILPLVIALAGGMYFMGDSFKSYQMITASEQGKLDVEKRADQIFDIIVTALKSRVPPPVGSQNADGCEPISAFKNLSQNVPPLVINWATPDNMPDLWCGLNLRELVQSFELRVEREAADTRNLTTTIKVGLTVTLPQRKGAPMPRYQIEKRLRFVAAKLADYSLILKDTVDSVSNHIQIQPTVTAVRVRGHTLIDMRGTRELPLSHIHERILGGAPYALGFKKVFTRNFFSYEQPSGSSELDMTNFRLMFASGIQSGHLQDAAMPYYDHDQSSDGGFHGPFGVTFDHASGDTAAPYPPLVRFSSGGTIWSSRIAPTSRDYSPAMAAMAYNIPNEGHAEIPGSSPTRIHQIRLDETCRPNPSNFHNPHAPLIVQGAPMQQITIDFSRPSAGNRFCGIINADTLQVVLPANSGSGAGNTYVMVGTFLVRRLLVQGGGTLIITHPTLVSDHSDENWPYTKAQTMNRFQQASGTTSNHYYKPLYHFRHVENVRRQFRAVEPYYRDDDNNIWGYFAPCEPPANMLCYRGSASTLPNFTDMNADEWKSMMFNLEVLL